MELMKKGEAHFRPEQAEDYCFARVFGFITKEKGGRLWPNLHGHESNRIEEVEKELAAVKLGKPISSKDHRVVQALAMYQKLNNLPVKATYPDTVNKSWSQFWKFLEYA
jgi:5-enolpyruvylshikimate-3-phosphate synthase